MNKLIDKLGWLYLQEGRLLVVRSKGKALFYIPGGKRDPGETDQQALIREISEELSVDLVPDSLCFAVTQQSQADGKPEDWQVKLTCYFAEYTGELAENSEIEEMRFIDLSDESVCSAATIAVLRWLRAQDASSLAQLSA